MFSKYTLSKTDGIPPRQLNYINAYRLLHPHRLVDPGDLTPLQVMQEPLFYNMQIVDSEGKFLVGKGADWVDVVRVCRISTAGDLARALAAGQHQVTGFMTTLRALYQSLPPAWRRIVSSPPALLEADWIWDPSRPSWVFAQSPTFHTAYNINPSGTVSVCLTALAPPDLSRCKPAFVWEWDASRPWHPASKRRRQGSRKAMYFGGAWDSVPLDPSTWGVGEQPSHEYIVREAAERRCLLRALNQTPPLVPDGTLSGQRWGWGRGKRCSTKSAADPLGAGGSPVFARAGHILDAPQPAPAAS